MSDEKPDRPSQPASWSGGPGADLERSSVRGAAATLTSQGLIFVTTLVSVSVLAHTLTPSDFGLLAMVTPIVSFMLLFQDMGLSMASVQRRQLSHTHVNQLFWLNVLAGFLLTVVVFACAPLVGRFFHDARLQPITMALSSTFFISGLAAQQRALLMREMRLVFLSSLQVLGTIVGAAAAVASAFLGLGYWSLVVLNLVQVVVVSVGVWTSPQFRPSFSFGMKGARDSLGFGLNYTGFRVLNFIARNTDNLLIGRFWGSVELGYYSRAYSLLLLPLNQLQLPFQNVVIPGLSRLQDDEGRYGRYYLKAISMLSNLALPAIAVLIAVAGDLVAVFLGPQWGPSVRIFRVLGIAGLLNVSYMTISWIYISLGRTRKQLYWWVVVVVVTVGGIAGGLPWGGLGVATGYAAANVVLYLPGLWHATRGTSITIPQILRASGPAALTAIVAGVVALLVSFAASGVELYGRLALELCAGAGSWVIASLLVSKRDSPLFWLLKLLKGGRPPVAPLAQEVLDEPVDEVL